MNLKTLDIEGFRSYKQQSFSLHPNLNIVVGLNGSGKTNLLEAVYVLSTTKSWRARDNSLLRENSNYYKLVGKTSDARVEVRYQNGSRRQLMLNQKPTKLEDYIGLFPTVLFEPSSLQIVYGQPEQRRRFYNGLLSVVDKRYLRSLLEYKRVLRQRNALLRDKTKHNLSDELFAWDIKLVELATYLVEARNLLSEYLNKNLQKLYRQITKDKTKLSLNYNPRPGIDDYGSQLLYLLNQNQARDRALGFTSVGPHRDELQINFNAQPAALVASRGEARTITLALKTLERQFIEQKTSKNPLLLLDDVFSELDTPRRRFLLEYLKPSQSLITTTDVSGIASKLPKQHKLIKL